MLHAPPQQLLQQQRGLVARAAVRPPSALLSRTLRATTPTVETQFGSNESLKGVDARFDALAALVCPEASGMLACADTELGRGLVARQNLAAGTIVLSVDAFNLLCVTDEPRRTGFAFSADAQQQWSFLHGMLPPALSAYLNSSATACTQRATSMLAVLAVSIMYMLQRTSCQLHLQTDVLLGQAGESHCSYCQGCVPPLPATAGRADWFKRLTAWLLWILRHGDGIWQFYAQLLPRVRRHDGDEG
jgi:hypothetical protein